MTIVIEGFEDLISPQGAQRMLSASDNVADAMLKNLVQRLDTGKDDIIRDLVTRADGELGNRVREAVGDNPFVLSAVNTTLNYSRAQKREILRNLLGFKF